LQDYLTGLRFWLTLNDPRLNRVLLLENSGYPLDALAALANDFSDTKQVEMISLPGRNVAPPGLDYGYSELLMIEEGLRQSRLVRETRYSMKVTGRLRFPGTSRLLDRLPRDLLFAVDSRNAWPIFGPPQLWVHTRMLIATHQFWLDEITPVRHRLKPLDSIEMVLYPTFANRASQPGAIRRWPVHVPAVGVSGFSGQSYQSWKRTTIDLVRSAAHVFTPNCWI
jgi:hypothetical protein